MPACAQAPAESECAFVERTAIQAEGDAREISERLSMPVPAFKTVEISGKHLRIPTHVKTVPTSHFHIEELKPLTNLPDLGGAFR